MRTIPPIVKNLLIINILAFAAIFVFEKSQGIDLNHLLGLHFVRGEHFAPWQFITYMFMHEGWEHLFFNMFALWMFGGIIERTLGFKRFLIYYFVCGIGAGICQEIAQLIQYSDVTVIQAYHPLKHHLVDAYQAIDGINPIMGCVGASGAIYGILLAFGMIYPNERMFIIPIPFPIKAKYLVLGYAVIELMSVLTRAHDGVAHVAHLGGMIFGILLILFWRKQDNKRNNGGGATYVSFDNYNRGY